jgi:dynein heavy chain 2
MQFSFSNKNVILIGITIQSEYVVETTLVGVVMNGLSHLYNVQDKCHFAVCLVRGLGGNIPEASREKFANEVC